MVFVRHGVENGDDERSDGVAGGEFCQPEQDGVGDEMAAFFYQQIPSAKSGNRFFCLAGNVEDGRHPQQHRCPSNYFLFIYVHGVFQLPNQDFSHEPNLGVCNLHQLRMVGIRRAAR